MSLAMRELTPADYETLLALDDNVAQQRLKGADAGVVARLPERVVGEGAGEGGAAAETCCICMEEMEVGSTVTMLPCAHSYHSECIRSWLAVDKRCPIDKEPVAE